jgi:hypothetical protein
MKKEDADMFRIFVLAFVLAGCAVGTGESVPASSGDNTTVDNSWVDDQRAQFAAQAQATDQQVQLQHDWDDFHAQQQKMWDDINAQQTQQAAAQ